MESAERSERSRLRSRTVEEGSHSARRKLCRNIHVGRGPWLDVAKHCLPGSQRREKAVCGFLDDRHERHASSSVLQVAVGLLRVTETEPYEYNRSRCGSTKRPKPSLAPADPIPLWAFFATALPGDFHGWRLLRFRGPGLAVCMMSHRDPASERRWTVPGNSFAWT